MTQRITGKTELVGLIAKPIRTSKSPMMHNTAFEALGLDLVYMVFEVDNSNLESAVQGLRSLGAVGFNVSMPNKAEVMKYLDEISPEARLCGAVNTVVNKNGVLYGTNTDGKGFMLACKEKGFDIIGKKITLIGAGGAATAIAMQAGLDGVAEISIFNGNDRFMNNAKANAERLNSETSCKARAFCLDDTDALRREIDSSVLLVNATGCGFGVPAGPCLIPDKSYLRPELKVVDIIYSPEKTHLLEMAEEVGCENMNGVRMMLHQGAAAFKLWTGKDMPFAPVEEALAQISSQK